ncbi:molybdopterin-dependent oxidoreductase [Thermodesulfobacteriota bacterium]
MLSKKKKLTQNKMPEDKWVPTICYSCNHGPDLIRVRRLNGVPINVEGNANGPGFVEFTQNRGRICPKPYGYIQKLYNPHRVKAPLKRTNPRKGIGIDPEWVEISWDEALDTVATKLKSVRSNDARKACFIYGGPNLHTNAGTWKAFLKAFGNPQILRGGETIRCDLAEHMFGNYIHGGWSCEPDIAYCNYAILLGRNPRASGGVGENVQYTDAQTRGMKMIVIDPVLTVTAANADEWIPIKPGTDLAFELALINVVLNEIGIVDVDFLKNLTNSPYLVGPNGYFLRDKASNKVLIWDPLDGRAKTYDDTTIKDFALEGYYVTEEEKCKPAFQVMKEHFRQYTPEWASKITEIPAGTIRRIGREWVDHARIGSTIRIGGVSLPYRPVAIKIGRGLTGNMRSYQSILCEHILAALVGALEVVGGHCGGRGEPREHRETQAHRGIIPGADGMLKLDCHPFVWPPISYHANETLLPYTKVMPYPLTHLGYKHLADPPANMPIPPSPEILIKYRTNPFLSVGEPRVIEKALSKIPFLVSIAYVLDETTAFADIVLPDHTELERYELSTSVRRALSKSFIAQSLRQPVVEPLHDTMDISDMMTELAERVGFLDEYNIAVNNQLALIDPWKLTKKKRYFWTEIVDRHCKSATKGTHDLEWFRQNGAIVEQIDPARQYSVHQVMLDKKLRYPIPYMEHVKKTGEELKQNLAKVNIDWWPTTEYVPLPIYPPSILDEVQPEYDFYVTITRSMQCGWGINVDNPWLIELGLHDLTQQSIVMNKGTAQQRGIKEGDEVWVESQVGKVKGRVKLIEGIRPDTILMIGQYGQWATPIAKDTGRVSEVCLTPIKADWTCHVTGSMQGNTVKAKIYKD